MASSEARVKRVLDIHLDSSVIDHLSTLAHVFSGGDGEISEPQMIPRTGAGLRAEIDRRSLNVAQTFLNQLSPVVSELNFVCEAVDKVVSACHEALDRAEQDEKVSAAFLAAAADTARRKAVVQGDVERLKEISSQYTLKAEYVQALEEGPEARGGAFFEALERVESIRTRALQMLAGDGKVINELPGVTGDQGTGAFIGEHALGLELLEGANAAQSSAFSNLFDWCLARCRQADVLFSGVVGDNQDDTEAAIAEQNERESILGSAGNLQSHERALRKGLYLLAKFRPGFCKACQEAAVNSRRSSFVRAFISALSTGSAAVSTGDTGQQSGELSRSGVRGRGGINAAAHDSLRYVSDLCAWIHLHSAEEMEAFASMFNEAITLAGEETTPSSPPHTSETCDGDPPSGSTQNSQLLSNAEMVTSVCDGLARPLYLRVEQVVNSPSTHLSVAYKMTDILAFFLSTLRGSLVPTSALLQGLQGVYEMCFHRVEELLQLQARRLRESSPAYPSSLSLTPLVSDMVSLLEEILLTSSSSLLSSPGVPSQEIQVGAKTSLFSIDVTHLVETLVDPLLESCRISAQGLRLLDTATFMCNQVCVVQSSLAPYASSSRIVQRLAAELTAYEESMVQALSEEVLSEAGILPKLTAVRSQAPGTNISMLPGLRAGEIRACCGALVASLSVSAGSGPLSAFDRIDNPRIRSRMRRDASSLLFDAFLLLHKAVADPTSGYGGAAGAAELLPSEEQMLILLDLK